MRFLSFLKTAAGESREIGLSGLVKQDRSFALLSSVFLCIYAETKRANLLFFPAGIFFGRKLNGLV